MYSFYIKSYIKSVDFPLLYVYLLRTGPAQYCKMYLCNSMNWLIMKRRSKYMMVDAIGSNESYN